MKYARALWGSGGTGRHAGLKILWPQGRVGSNPTCPTNKRKRMITMTLYVVKTFHEYGLFGFIGQTDAVFLSYEEAILCMNNPLDISDDGFNEYIMIGRVETGIYQVVEEMLWGRWNRDKQIYEKSERPDALKHMCHMI